MEYISNSYTNPSVFLSEFSKVGDPALNDSPLSKSQSVISANNGKDSDQGNDKKSTLAVLVIQRESRNVFILDPHRMMPDYLNSRVRRQTPSASTEIDSRSEGIIKTLNPKVWETFSKLYQALKQHFKTKGIVVKFISGNRTYTEQNGLYAKGRPEICRVGNLEAQRCSGSRVTNARGGYSNHNFGLAVDIGLFKDNNYLANSDHYRDIGRIVARFPQLEWGGNWRSLKDEPHVQWKTNLTMAEMRGRVERGEVIV